MDWLSGQGYLTINSSSRNSRENSLPLPSRHSTDASIDGLLALPGTSLMIISGSSPVRANSVHWMQGIAMDRIALMFAPPPSRQARGEDTAARRFHFNAGDLVSGAQRKSRKPYRKGSALICMCRTGKFHGAGQQNGDKQKNKHTVQRQRAFHSISLPVKLFLISCCPSALQPSRRTSAPVFSPTYHHGIIPPLLAESGHAFIPYFFIFSYSVE